MQIIGKFRFELVTFLFWFVGCWILVLNEHRQSLVSGSAIPMWEFLTKNEKIEILEQVLKEIVDIRCLKIGESKKTDRNCQRKSLNMARDKLQTLSEFEIDLLDPLQRNAHSISDQYSIETNKLNGNEDGAADDHREEESQIIEKKIEPENQLFSKLFTVLNSMYTNELEDRLVEIRLFPNGSHVPETLLATTTQDDHQHHEQIK